MSVTRVSVKQKSGAPRKIELAGLCTNCNNADHCSYARNAKKPVQFCEMYDGHSEEPARADLSEVLRSDPADLRPEMPHSKGLCVNCANRETCAWAQREGGVWHCEEYR
ncbi:MAG: hypothetical protein R6X12_10485 [bacterium]